MADPDQLNNAESGVCIALPERLDTASAPALLADLAPHQNEDICLDFERVTMLGTLCLQVLMNARHHWATAGHAVSLKNMMPPIEKALADFGTTPQALATGGTS